jgi:hypothetical protein
MFRNTSLVKCGIVTIDNANNVLFLIINLGEKILEITSRVTNRLE